MIAESIGLALLIVLESLTPPERLAFVLHDIFAVPFGNIGPVMGRTTEAAASLERASSRLEGGGRPCHHSNNGCAERPSPFRAGTAPAEPPGSIRSGATDAVRAHEGRLPLFDCDGLAQSDPRLDGSRLKTG